MSHTFYPYCGFAMLHPCLLFIYKILPPSGYVTHYITLVKFDPKLE